jgi:hypothetical protein
MIISASAMKERGLLGRPQCGNKTRKYVGPVQQIEHHSSKAALCKIDGTSVI